MHGQQDPDEAQYLASYDAGKYPHPSLAVDVVLLTVADDGLRTLLIQRTEQPQLGRWAIPGGFVRMDESLDDAAQRVLATKVGLEDAFTEQLYTFGEPGRDPRTRVISVTYYALVAIGRLEAIAATRPELGVILAAVETDKNTGATRALDANGAPVPLAFDHDQILSAAIARIRGKLDYAPIGFELLPDTFTLLDLRRVHEAILGRPLNKDSFRRKVLDRGLVEATGRRATGLGHRPPELYCFARADAARDGSDDR